MERKVFVFSLGLDINAQTITLESMLNDGWSIIRCDSPHVGGENSSYGRLVYILERVKR